MFSFIGAVIATRVAINYFDTPIEFYFVMAMIFSICLLTTQWRFARIGIHSAQPSVAKGTNYKESLRLCKDQLSFLGKRAPSN